MSGQKFALRGLLGMAQMFGATMAAVLLWRSGLTPLTLGLTLATCVLTTISVLLFGSRRPRLPRQDVASQVRPKKRLE